MSNEIIQHDFTGYDFSFGILEGIDIIWIAFKYDPQKIKIIKSFTDARWMPSERKWFVADNDNNRLLFNLPLKIQKVVEGVSNFNAFALQKLKNELEIRAYSPNTIKTYSNEFLHLLKFLKDKNVDELSEQDLRTYILYCIKKLKHSENLIHSRINAIKFYFEKVNNQRGIVFNVPRPKKPSTLPKSLSQQDIKKMFNVMKNTKHLLLLKMCYGMGLRVSEIVNLKIQHIDSQKMQVLIEQSKGKRDRCVILPTSILELLRIYYLEYRPKYYLFEGVNHEQYSIRSVQAVFRKAMKLANINKKIGIHSLRHSYATHLIEQGTDIRFVQDLLGHKNIKTTMIYTNLTDQFKRNIKSPLDQLEDFK